MANFTVDTLITKLQNIKKKHSGKVVVYMYVGSDEVVPISDVRYYSEKTFWEGAPEGRFISIHY